MDAGAKGRDAVHTVHDYYDGPLSGAANFSGIPHAYKRIFDEEDDEWGNEYLLSPITEEQLQLVKEDFAMFLRWRAAHDVGKLGPRDTHAVLAADRPRRDQIARSVERALSVDPARAIRVVAEFEGPFSPLSPSGALWVRWSNTD